MEVNKDEAERCIELAEKYIKASNREKAEKFLHKAERLYPTDRAKGKIVCSELFNKTDVSQMSQICYCGSN